MADARFHSDTSSGSSIDSDSEVAESPVWLKKVIAEWKANAGSVEACQDLKEGPSHGSTSTASTASFYNSMFCSTSLLMDGAKSTGRASEHHIIDKQPRKVSVKSPASFPHLNLSANF